ncbi:MAG: nucleotide exchange factor GrpE [Bacteroidales bacterium]|nr:nucleotide exchange factor GrpE [Bacteroidales bacterium]
MTKSNKEQNDKSTIGADKHINKEKSKSKSHKTSKDKDHKKDQLIEELKEQVEKEHNSYLRLSADFDNFRKRTLKEKADLTKFAGEDILLSLLPVIDDFERAIQHLDSGEDTEHAKDGLKLIYSKFKEFLKKNNLQEIDALHKDFDTDLHEAITKIPAAKKNLRGKVVDVIEKGYMLNGKVIRYAKVVIGE